MPRIDRTTYDFECDFPGCPKKGTTNWSTAPPGWVTLHVGASRGRSDWYQVGRQVIACSGEHARAVARTWFEVTLDTLFRGMGVKT